MAKPKAGILPGVGDIQAMWEASGLKTKLLFTVMMLAVFRLGAQVPVWGVHPERIQALLGNQMLGFLDMFSGGALTSVSVLALGIGPYITASIIIAITLNGMNKATFHTFNKPGMAHAFPKVHYKDLP